MTYADVDCRAIRITGENLASLKLKGTPCLTNDLSQLAPGFDLIVSNPPTHAGSNILQRLFVRMVELVTARNQVKIVVRAQLNYEKWLSSLGNLSELHRENGYKILQLVKYER